MSRESSAFEDYSSIKPLNKLGQLKDSNATARSIDTGFSQAVRLKRIKNDIERPIYMLESTRIITISLQKELVGTLFRK